MGYFSCFNQQSGLKRNFKDTPIKTFFVDLVNIQFSIKRCLPPAAAQFAIKTVFAEKDCNYIYFFPKYFFIWPPNEMLQKY